MYLVYLFSNAEERLMYALVRGRLKLHVRMGWQNKNLFRKKKYIPASQNVFTLSHMQTYFNANAANFFWKEEIVTMSNFSICHTVFKSIKNFTFH